MLHVEQEVDGDDTPAIQSVLECDTKREKLLKEEKEINAALSASRSVYLLELAYFSAHLATQCFITY